MARNRGIREAKGEILAFWMMIVSRILNGWNQFQKFNKGEADVVLGESLEKTKSVN